VLRDAVSYKVPYVSSTVKLAPDDLSLFYKKGVDVGFLNFTTASDEHLSHLSEACDPATFGRNDEDVVDETYRKAGKIDTPNFFSSFDLNASGLLRIISDKLLP